MSVACFSAAARAAAIATSRLRRQRRRADRLLPLFLRQAVKSFPTTIVMSPTPDGTADDANPADPQCRRDRTRVAPRGRGRWRRPRSWRCRSSARSERARAERFGDDARRDRPRPPRARRCRSARSRARGGRAEDAGEQLVEGRVDRQMIVEVTRSVGMSSTSAPSASASVALTASDVVGLDRLSAPARARAVENRAQQDLPADTGVVGGPCEERPGLRARHRDLAGAQDVRRGRVGLREVHGRRRRPHRPPRRDRGG